MMSQENRYCQPDFLPKSRPAPVPQWTTSLRDNRKQVRVLKEDLAFTLVPVPALQFYHNPAIFAELLFGGQLGRLG